MALIAAELRRDALIAPSGCGQYRGEEGRWRGGVQSMRKVSSLPDVVIGLIVYIWFTHIGGQMYLLQEKPS